MTIQQLFMQFPYLSRKQIAVKSGVSYDSVRQYAIGILETAKQIGEELAAIPVK